MPLKLDAEGLTDVGRKRAQNEDSLALNPEHHVFVVADGMGGHASGDVASQMAVETVGQFFRETSEDEERTWPYKMDKSRSYEANRLAMGVKLANKLIFQRAQNDIRLKSMGTTIVATLLQPKQVIVGHVGDSRVYRVREQKIEQLTEDHSLLNDYMKIKKLTPEEIKNFPHKNVIVRALGMKDVVQVDVGQYDLKVGDIFLLCSDGLSGLVEDDGLEEIVNEHADDLKRCCQELIDAANRNGGNDNITAVLIKVLELGD